MDDRTCIKCKESKPIDSYYRIRTYWHTSCKVCMNKIRHKADPHLRDKEINEINLSKKMDLILKGGLILK